MKVSGKILLLPFILAATFAYAQTLPHFQHIIIIVQENRTPDNLFGSNPSRGGCSVEFPFEPGVDIEDGGMGYGQVNKICSTPRHLQDSLGLGHGHGDWINQCDQDPNTHLCKMDKVCWNGAQINTDCYAYVYKTDVQPYFDIATNYGFANYMFQTNEGPSFEAHQFLFTGTSAGVAPTDQYSLDFVAENADSTDSGCSEGQISLPKWVDPRGAPDITDPRLTKAQCYPHDSLVTCGTGTNCDKGVSWAYYSPTAESIWTAPAAIPEVCYGENDLNPLGHACGDISINGGTEWNNHVFLETTNNGAHNGAPIFDALDDVTNCNLPQITWVIPDKLWSDHSTETGPYGPSYVGDIVDAVGEGILGSQCNPYTPGGGRFWKQEPTAIFILWDDWGGWFDHVPPPAVYTGTATTCPTNVQQNGWGCGYVYGFRVPLLVVSEYTQAHYVSGACGNCPNKVFPFVHDFGSILAFTEHNFGMQTIAKPYYADFNALDGANGNTPLSDFFGVNNQRDFTHISTEQPFTYFQSYSQYDPNWVPTGPDDDSEVD